MSNYNKATNFAVKDTLTSGDPDKVVSGAEIDNEFNAIASAVTSKVDKVESATTDNLAALDANGNLKDSGKNFSEILPSGVVVLWSGIISSIPTGWGLCDGTNGTPDLRNRFVVGAGDTYSPNNTGGANSVTITESQMPSHDHSMSSAGSHSHSGSTSTNGSHTHGISTFQASTPITNLVSSGNQGSPGNASTSSAGSHNHSLNINSNGNHTHNINNAGGDQAHENRPPYFALAYIMKL